MKSIIVSGPQGCGKTTNASRIVKALGLKRVRDSWVPGTPYPQEDTLVLTNGVQIVGAMSYRQAMQAVEESEASPGMDETEILTNRLNYAYHQRNLLAIGFAKMAIEAGYVAGRGIDSAVTDPEWSHVVYIEFPNGEQVSWHMAPTAVAFLEGLPEYKGEWDGTYLGRYSDWLNWKQPKPVCTCADSPKMYCECCGH